MYLVPMQITFGANVVHHLTWEEKDHVRAPVNEVLSFGYPFINECLIRMESRSNDWMLADWFQALYF